MHAQQATPQPTRGSAHSTAAEAILLRPDPRFYLLAGDRETSRSWASGGLTQSVGIRILETTAQGLVSSHVYPEPCGINMLSSSTLANLFAVPLFGFGEFKTCQGPKRLSMFLTHGRRIIETTAAVPNA